MGMYNMTLSPLFTPGSSAVSELIYLLVEISVCDLLGRLIVGSGTKM